MNPISRIAPVTDAQAARMVHPGTLADLAERLTSMPAGPAAGTGAAASRTTWHSPRPRRQLILTSAAAVAVLAVTAAVVVNASGTPASKGPTGPTADTGGADTAAARVLHHAALAALQSQAGTPRPGQFIYTKTENGDGSLYQSWLSVNGTRTGLVRGAGGGLASISIPGCRDGHQLRVSAARAAGGTPGGQHCVPQPAYFPGMPTSPRALRWYLKQHFGAAPASPGYLNDFGKTIDQLLTQAYLSSGQRAALYDLMAQTPGFTLLPHAVDIIGRRGVGAAWSLPGGGGKTVIIFDPKTYALLGVTTWGAGGQKGGGALLKLTMVNKPGQRP